MAQYNGLLEAIPVADIAQQLGVTEDVAASAVQQAIPVILGGLSANAQDAAGAASLEKALGSHTGGVPTTLGAIDTADGEKIVKNVFGTQTTKVQEAVAVAAPSSSVTQDLIAKLLPILAPIVLSWLASQFFGKKDAPAQAAPSSGGGLGDVLGGLLGGGTSASSSSSSGGGIGDLLGGLLGGSGGGDLLGGVLGGLLGGGKR